MNLLKKDIIFSNVNKLKGVGKQLSKYLKNRKIEKVKDILLNLPYSETDRSKIISLDSLEHRGFLLPSLGLISGYLLNS